MFLVGGLRRSQPLQRGALVGGLDGYLRELESTRNTQLQRTYIDFNRLMEFDTLVETDLQGRSIRLQRSEQFPFGRLAVDLDAVDIQMAGVQQDIAGIAVGDRLELVNDIAGEFLLVKENVEVGGDMGGQPVVVVGQRVGIARGVDDGRHATDLDELSLLRAK